MKKALRFITAAVLTAGLAGCSGSATAASSAAGSAAPASSAAGSEAASVNPHGYVITPVEAANLPLNLPDLDLAVINGNFALEAKLNETCPAIAIESFDEETSIRRTNYLAVKEGNENSDKIKALVAAITSEDVKAYIEGTYKGAVITSFIDAEGKPVAGGEIPDAAGDDTRITVGATLVPHAEILNNVIADVLKAHGWELKVVEFNDYVLPNTSLEEGELDANYFQTLGYLNGQNEERGLHLVASVGVHIEPMGVYSQKFASLQEIPDGASIGVPNDTDNYGRAIELLNALGLLNGAPIDPEQINQINK